MYCLNLVRLNQLLVKLAWNKKLVGKVQVQIHSTLHTFSDIRLQYVISLCIHTNIFQIFTYWILIVIQTPTQIEIKKKKLLCED
jgi:hypothetical protein